MKGKIIIFGATCQDGYYLSNLLQPYDLHLVGSHRSPGGLDIRDHVAVNNAIALLKPSYIFNLASVPSTSHDRHSEIYSTIYNGCLNILDSVYRSNLKTRVILASSAYAYQPSVSLLHLDSPYRFDNPYSLARVNAANLAKYYLGLGVDVTTAYLFHHESKYRSNSSLLMQLATQILEVADGARESVIVKDATIRKEWNHAEDLMRALINVALNCRTSEIIIASGLEYRIIDVIKTFSKILGIDPPHLNSQFAGRIDPTGYIGDSSYIRSLGWEPSIGIYELCKEILDHLQMSTLLPFHKSL